ncbi:hypothetical protein [Xenorhabdus santafensis]|nr:hypothetical protein [Xenorhabdus sp. 12]
MKLPYRINGYIPVVFQVAALLAALTYPNHIINYALGNVFPCRRAPTQNP